MSLFWLEVGLVSSVVIGFLTWLLLSIATDDFGEFWTAVCGLGVFVLVSLLTLGLNVGTLEFGLTAAAILAFFAWFLLAGATEDFDEGWPVVTGIAIFVFGAILTIGETIGWTWVIIGIALTGAIVVGLYVLTLWFGDQSLRYFLLAKPAASALHSPVPSTEARPASISPNIPAGQLVFNINTGQASTPPESYLHCTHCGQLSAPRNLNGVLRCPSCGGSL